MARERRGEEDQMADVANNQANMFHRNLVNLGKLITFCHYEEPFVAGPGFLGILSRVDPRIFSG